MATNDFLKTIFILNEIHQDIFISSGEFIRSKRICVESITNSKIQTLILGLLRIYIYIYIYIYILFVIEYNMNFINW